MSDNYQVKPVDTLFRWLHPSQFDWKEKRPTSAAFRDPYMSADVAKLTSVEESYERAKKIGKDAVVSFLAKQAFDHQQKIHHCPTLIFELTNDSVCALDAADVSSKKLVCTNPAHACVVGKKTSSISKSFAKNCKVEIFPPEPN